MGYLSEGLIIWDSILGVVLLMMKTTVSSWSGLPDAEMLPSRPPAPLSNL